MEIWKVAQRLEESTTPEDLWQATLKVLWNLGFEFVVYLTVNMSRHDPVIWTNIPEIYVRVPTAKDPFLDHLCTSYSPGLTGSAFLEDYDYLSDEEQAFIRDASKATGFTAGMSLPMRLQGSGRFGGFNIGTRLDRHTFCTKHMPNVEDMRFLCLIVHRRMEEMLQHAPAAEAARHHLIAPRHENLSSLSPRENEVMYLMAHGLTRKECARICNISPNTAAEYIKGAYKKLGVNNKIDAVKRYERLAAPTEPMPS